MKQLEDIRRRFVDDVQQTRFVTDILSGHLVDAAYVHFLRSAFHYAQFSPVVMALAAARTSRTHPELSRYLLHHADEEQGHDAWALHDLRDLGLSEHEVRDMTPALSCSALVGYVHYVAAHANPVGLFGWMYVLEAMGKDVAEIVGANLARGLRVPAAVRFIARHGVTDQDHATEIAETIAKHVDRAEDVRAICEVADVVANLYGEMLREAGGERKQWA